MYGLFWGRWLNCLFPKQVFKLFSVFSRKDLYETLTVEIALSLISFVIKSFIVGKKIIFYGTNFQIFLRKGDIVGF